MRMTGVGERGITIIGCGGVNDVDNVSGIGGEV